MFGSESQASRLLALCLGQFPYTLRDLLDFFAKQGYKVIKIDLMVL